MFFLESNRHSSAFSTLVLQQHSILLQRSRNLLLLCLFFFFNSRPWPRKGEKRTLLTSFGQNGGKKPPELAAITHEHAIRTGGGCEANPRLCQWELCCEFHLKSRSGRIEKLTIGDLRGNRIGWSWKRCGEFWRR